MTGMPARARALWIAALAGLLVGCDPQDPEPRVPGSPAPLPGTASDPLDVAFERVLERWDPARARAGFTLLLAQRRHPVLVGMDGRVVHAWPEVAVRDRARLLRNGDLLVIDRVGRVARYAWDGQLVWRFAPDDRAHPRTFPHHDAIELRSGNVLSIWKEQREDVLLELDGSGSIVWRWKPPRDLRRRYADRVPGNGTLHFNSLQELPPNHWHDAGDLRFAPGNILVSARSLSAIFIIDRQTGDVVWEHAADLDRQHEASMIPEPFPRAGEIQIFDNRYEQSVAPGGERHSRVIAIDPSSHEITWHYQSERLYSATVGVQQPLPGGNVFIGSSGGGRVFEVTPDGEIVWQLIVGRGPVRPSRYAPDHAPQLASLPVAGAPAPGSPPGPPYVDRSLRAFADARELRRLEKGKPDFALRLTSGCRRVFAPPQPALELAFGVLPTERNRGARLRFRAEFQPEDGGPGMLLLDRSLVASTERVSQSAAPTVDELAGRWGRLCLEVALDGRPASFREEGAYWRDPAFASGAYPEPATAERDPREDAELEMDREHLRTLGYVQ